MDFFKYGDSTESEQQQLKLLLPETFFKNLFSWLIISKREVSL